MSVRKMLNLQGRTAFVTGSSDGIGKAIVLALAEMGCDVIIHARDNEAECRKVMDSASGFGVSARYVLGDISRKEAIEDLAKKVSGFAMPDILVLNASVQIRRSFREITYDEYEMQTNANLWSTARLIQHFAPGMIDRKWGRILTLGSVQQVKPHKDMAIYAATKSAVVTLVKNLAMQYAKDGITVNNLAPGVITTRRNEAALADPSYAELVRGKIPSGTFGQPDDCAGLAVLLCSEASRYVTGQDIFCDGGMSL